MSEATRWPVDYDTLEKGHVIPLDQVEKLVECKQESAAFQFKLLQLKERIESDLHKMGKHWTLCTERGAIKVLTDAEASEYNHQEQERARRAMLRRFHLASSVDVAQLTEEQRHQHERSIEIDGKYVQAIATTRKQIKLESHKRSTPLLAPAPAK